MTAPVAERVDHYCPRCMRRAAPEGVPVLRNGTLTYWHEEHWLLTPRGHGERVLVTAEERKG